MWLPGKADPTVKQKSRPLMYRSLRAGTALPAQDLIGAQPLDCKMALTKDTALVASLSTLHVAILPCAYQL